MTLIINATNKLREKMEAKRIEWEHRLLSEFNEDYTIEAWGMVDEYIGENAPCDIADYPDEVGDILAELVSIVGDLQYQRRRLIEALNANGIPIPHEIEPTPDDLKPITPDDVEGDDWKWD